MDCQIIALLLLILSEKVLFSHQTHHRQFEKQFDEIFKTFSRHKRQNQLYGQSPGGFGPPGDLVSPDQQTSANGEESSEATGPQQPTQPDYTQTPDIIFVVQRSGMSVSHRLYIIGHLFALYFLCYN